MEKPKECFRTRVGGQALIEGIMMRGPEKICVAVRKPDGTIDLMMDQVKHHPWSKIPFLRGVLNMVENLVLGYRYLMHSADVSLEDEEEEEPSKLEQWLQDHLGDAFEKALMGAASVLGVVLASLITGNPYLTAAGTGYVNLSMFFAFAFLFPDTTVLLFFILPVKMKWLAYLDGALFAFDIIKAIGAHNWAGVVLPIVALLNFAVFIWPEVHYLKERAKYQNSRKTVQFRQAQQQQAKQAQQQGYRHKCAVCGRTDTDYPDLQFRYCSKCVGYHCFCQDHIFNHVHFTEE